jgi:hypothetical protein
MKPVHYLLLSLSSFFIGIIFYCYYHEIIVIRKFSHTNRQPVNTAPVVKRNFTLHYWKDKAWHKDEKELIDAEDKSQTLNYLITSWLGLTEEEGLLQRKTSIQSIMLDAQGQEVFISFDCNPFKKDFSTQAKWMWIEGLLKTVRENNIPVNAIRFLVHHKPLHDYHLDFSHSWPITGFLPTLP